jgi:hypothetical protein
MKNKYFYTLIYLFLLFSCSTRKITEEDRDKVYNYINNYITQSSKYPEYKELRKTFDCFYKNAVKNERKFYVKINNSFGEAFLGLDSFVIFNNHRDSALLFYVLKNRNNIHDGFHYSTPQLFAYKTEVGWRFYDGCADAIYPDNDFTLQEAIRRERLSKVFDNNWLLNWSTDNMKINENFLRDACQYNCGICTEEELKNDVHCQEYKERQAPPDSLYKCN